MENERMKDSPWKTKRAKSRWSQIWDQEARTSNRVWQKKFSRINWNYWFSANGNWSYQYRCEQSRRDQLQLQEELSEQNRYLRETWIKSLHEMEELKREGNRRGDWIKHWLMLQWYTALNCEQYISHVTFFSCSRACVIICHTTLAQVFVRVIPCQQTLVLVWRRIRRRDHRQSALFTTAHSRARRTSGPETSLSLSWGKFVAKSVVVCRSCENGETC